MQEAFYFQNDPIRPCLVKLESLLNLSLTLDVIHVCLHRYYTSSVVLLSRWAFVGDYIYPSCRPV